MSAIANFMLIAGMFVLVAGAVRVIPEQGKSAALYNMWTVWLGWWVVFAAAVLGWEPIAIAIIAGGMVATKLAVRYARRKAGKAAVRMSTKLDSDRSMDDAQREDLLATAEAIWAFSANVK